MKKSLIAAALIVGFSTSVLAVENNFIMFDNTMKGGKGGCVIMTTQPTGSQYKLMGKYTSKAAAEAAMKTMKECG